MANKLVCAICGEDRSFFEIKKHICNLPKPSDLDLINQKLDRIIEILEQRKNK